MSSSRWLRFIITLFLLFSERFAFKKPCHDLLACLIEKTCVNLPWLVGRIQGAEISEQMYNDLDSAIDYGCIFTSGCPRECTACTLCHNSKLRVMKVLAGADPNLDAECRELIDCAKGCLAKGASNMSNVGRCLRHRCAYHCFNGSCPKCSAFITKV
uniref:Defensin-like protein n=1 Tax=Angiostrongylus cantonensis TaxID=6313 RepID=A0A0K0CVY2_ANGCA